MRLHVSVGRDQMTFAYYEGGRLYVHGDTPVSRLDRGTIGEVGGVPFYVHVFTKDKSFERGGGGRGKSCEIEVLDIGGRGYIHQAESEEEKGDFGFEMVEREEVDAEGDEEAGGVKLEGPAEDEEERLVEKMEGVKI